MESIAVSRQPVLTHEKTEVSARLRATGDSFGSVLVTFYDGDPAQGGQPFDVELIPFIGADDVYQTNVIFKPGLCGTHTIHVVGSAADTASATNSTTIEVGCHTSAYALYATERIVLGRGSVIHSGNVGVRDVGAKVTIGRDVALADGVSIFGDTVVLRAGASVDDVYYNALQVSDYAIIRGDTFTPLSLPLDAPFPLIPRPLPGNREVHVPPGTLLTLPPGAYHDISLGEHATLVLTGGTYHAEALAIGKHAKVLCQARCDFVVKQRLRSHQGALIGPQDGADLTATDIHLFVHGQITDIGPDNRIAANIFAPNGTIWIRADSVVEGALLGKRVLLGLGVTVTLRSGF